MRLSMMTIVRRVWLVAAFSVCAAATLRAQGGTGRIEGTLHDEQGGVLPGVTMVLRNQESGVTRTLVTEADGRYGFPALGPGQYQLRAELTGFATQESKDITITIGLELRRDFVMKLQSVAETIIVTADAPVVDVTKAEVAGLVSKQQIESLPINSRQYLSLALLVPGTTVDATRSFFSTVNAGGSMTFNGTGNVVDGMINNWVEDGEPRQDLPEDAVEEFKVSNSQYKAEFGLATGGVVQVVTKSGANLFHGDGFEYFRDKSLNALGVFEATKPAYRRNQFGGALGGPIVQDKIHFFASAERTKTDQFYTVTTGQPLLYGSLEGTFAQPTTKNLYSGRVDWQVSNSQNVVARYMGERELQACVGCGGTVASGRDQQVPRDSVVLGHTWINGNQGLNDFRFQYAHAAFYGFPTGTAAWTNAGTFDPARIARLTRTYTFPSLTFGSSYDDVSPESRWEFKETYTRTYSHHELKFGGEINRNHYIEDEAINYLVGTMTFGKDEPFNPAVPASVAALTGPTLFTATSDPVSTNHPSKYYVAFVEDDWKARSNVTVTLGLRYERLYGPLNEDLNPADFPVALPYVNVGARGDTNNFGPRTGVAWDVAGDGKTVVRSGYGMYYGHVRTLAALEEFRNFHRLSITIANPAYPDPYRGQDPHSFIVASTAPNLTIAANDMVQPLAHQASAGISRKLSELFALHIDGVYNRTYHDYKTLNINAADPVTGLRPLPQFGRIDQVQSTSDLHYKALYAKLDKRYSRRTQFLLSYAYTRSDDNQPFSRYLDPFNHTIDVGPSNGERRHAIVASGSVLVPGDVTVGVVWTLRSQLPWSATAGLDLNKDTFNTDLVPGTTRNSGRDLNLVAVNAWRATNGLAAIPASQIDTSVINDVDARISKAVRLNGRKVDLIAQLFNLFNTVNLGDQYNSGRVTNALSNSFGRILTARPNRQGELAIKFTW
jgi:hypothetical protein